MMTCDDVFWMRIDRADDIASLPCDNGLLQLVLRTPDKQKSALLQFSKQATEKLESIVDQHMQECPSR